MDKGDMQSAQIIGAEVIRCRTQAANLHKMSGKMQAVSLKIDSAIRSQQISQQIKQSVPGLKNALK